MFSFNIKGTALSKDEAHALLELSSETPIALDLAKVVDLRKLNSKKLFQLSVEKQNPSLAQLAYKISTRTTLAKPRIRAARKPVEYVDLPVGKLLLKLTDSTSLWATGAAMILEATSNESEWTVRQIATHFANTLGVSSKSVLFKGFTLINGSWEPLTLKEGAKRSETFHACPTYMALREGAEWLVKNGLVARTEAVSKGSYSESETPQVAAMSRVYHKLTITNKGKDLLDLWSDIEDFITNSFDSRLR